MKIGGSYRLCNVEREPSEVEDFAGRHHLLPEYARNIIRCAGGSRKQADEIAGRELRTLHPHSNPLGHSIAK